MKFEEKRKEQPDGPVYLKHPLLYASRCRFLHDTPIAKLIRYFVIFEHALRFINGFHNTTPHVGATTFQTHVR